MLELPGDRQQQLAETMNKMVMETTRAARVVERLREFFRAGALRLERAAVGTVLRSAVETVGRRAEREGVSITVEVAPDLPDIYVDRVHIETALHNLLVNGVEAAASVSGGERRVAVRAQGGKEGAVVMRVCDSGPGVSEQVASRLFEPLATTKPGGMGLGLAISRTLVEAHGGTLSLVAGGGNGACFELILPPLRGEQQHG